MRYRKFGKMDWNVSEIGLGGLFLNQEDRETGIALVRRALDLGVNFFDTAPSYNISQLILGEALDGEKRPHFVSSKIGPTRETYWRGKYDRDSILKQFESNLKELRRDRVDMLFIHDPDRCAFPYPGSLEAVLAKGMALETLQELKSQGLIGAIGLASLWLDYQTQCIETGALDIILTFNRYGLVWRDAQFQTFPFCHLHNVAIVQGTPLHQGLFTRPHPEWITSPPAWMTAQEHDRYRRLLDVQGAAGIPLPELAIRFILNNPAISTVLAGAGNLDQLEMNIECSDTGPLPPDIQAQVEALGILHIDPRRYL